MTATLSIAYWAIVISYSASFGLFSYGTIFRSARVVERAVLAAWVGFSLHTAVVTARWIAAGHPPFVSYFESMFASAWFGVLAFLVAQGRKTHLRPAGLWLMLLVTLLMGWAGTHPFDDEPLPVSLQSFWLFIHATFATSAVGCFLFAAGVGFYRLYRTQWPNGVNGSLGLVLTERYDELNARLVLLGFLFYSMMIVSGSIWADTAWGRYWGWDPIEVWSLITWLLYAIYLHFYFTIRRLRGSFLAWYALIAVFVAAFSLWGVGILYRTIHTYAD